MKKAFFFIASAVAILAGCAREASIETPETGRKHITIQASVNPETRTTVNIADGIGTYAWANDEQIAVFESTADAATPFTVNDPENGYFDGEIEAGNTLIGAVSPKGAVTEMVSVDGEVEYTLSFSGQYNQGETNAIMVAGAPEIIESDPDSEPLYKFQFKHAAGLMKVTYANIPVGAAGVKFSTNKPITGTVDLETLTGVEITNNDVNGESEAVVLLDAPVTEANTTSEFFVPVPTGSYTGFTICLIDDGGNAIPGTTKSKSTAFTVERADIIRIPTVTLKAVEVVEGYFKVTDESEITAGDYLIVYEGDDSHNPRVLSGVDAEKNLGTCADVVIENSFIDETSYAAYNIVASKLVNGNFTLKLGSVYLAYTSTETSKYNNLWGVDAADSDGTEWILSVGEVKSALNTGRTIQYNYNQGNDRFAGYASSQSHIALYKKGSSSSVSKLPADISFAEGSPFTVDPTEAANFTAPQLINPNGLTITWSIEDEDEIAVFDESDGSLILTGAPGTITVTATSAETSVFAVGSASYTVTVTAGTLASIQALKDAIDANNGTETEYELSLNNVIVSWAKNGKAYLEDGSAGIFVYAGAEELQAGHRLSGKTKVKAKIYNGQREITAITGTALSELMGTETVDIPVSNQAIADVNNDEEDQSFENMRVVIENATIVVSNNKKYLSDGSDQIQLYALSGSGASLEGLSAGDVILSAVGYPMYYHNNETHFPELIIVSTDDIVKPAEPKITANPASLSFTNAAGSQSISMIAESFNGNPSYSVTSNTNSAVFSTSVNGNTITVTVAANDGEEQTGVITIKGTVGEQSAETTVNLTQAAAEGISYSYSKVSSLSDVTEGEYIIVNDGYYLPNAIATNAGPVKSENTKVSVSNNVVQNVTEDMTWTLTGSASAMTIKSTIAGSYYLVVSGNGNSNLRVTTTTGRTWTISDYPKSSGAFTLKDNTNNRYCASYNTDWRSYNTYNASNYADDGKISLYKKTVSHPSSEVTLASIAITQNPSKTVFTVGDPFEFDGKVIATYSDSSTKDVSDDITTDGETVVMSTGENKTVTVSYTDNGITKTTTYTITVNASTVGTHYYTKVTTTSNLTDGQYLIVCEEFTQAYDGSVSDLSASGAHVEVTISDNKILATSALNGISFTITTANGSSTIQSASGYYIGQTSDSNGVKFSKTEAYSNTISFDSSGNANIIASGGPYLRYNSSGAGMFRYYKSTTYSAQKAIQLYKYN